MATVITDNFDSYSDGAIDGQGPWINGGGAGNNNAIQSSGSRSGKCVVLNNQENLLSSAQAGTNTGKQTCYMKAAQTNKAGFGFIVRTTAGPFAGAISFNNSGVVEGAVGPSSVITLGNYSANTYYKCQIEWRASDHKVRYSFNNGNMTDWDASYSGNGEWTTGNITQTYFPCSTGVGGTFYVDDLYEGETSYTLTTQVGQFILNGINVTLTKAKNYLISTIAGQFILTGLNSIWTFAGTTFDWKNQSKHNVTMKNNEDKHEI